MNNKILIVFLYLLLIAGCTTNDSIQGQQEVKNVILMIGDGMGLNQVYAAYTAAKGKLNLEKAEYIGLSKTHSANSYETDSGAGGTAILTGEKTDDKNIGLDVNKKPLKTLLEIAEENSLSTGLVATSAITHATPASFIAHQPSRYMYGAIARDFIDSGIDIFIGGGKSHFVDSSDVNVLEELRAIGYQITDRLEDIDPADSSNIGCLMAEDGMPKIREGRGDFLPRATKIALEKLSHNENGFFIMIEGSQIDWGGHDNDLDYVVTETLDFDKAVGEAFAFADRNPGTLVVVTADHETGGLTITDGDLRTGKLEAHFSTGDHTGVMVPVYAYGSGAEIFAGIYENTEIFHKIMELFAFED